MGPEKGKENKGFKPRFLIFFSQVEGRGLGQQTFSELVCQESGLHSVTSRSQTHISWPPAALLRALQVKEESLHHVYNPSILPAVIRGHRKGALPRSNPLTLFISYSVAVFFFNGVSQLLPG